MDYVPTIKKYIRKELTSYCTDVDDDVQFINLPQNIQQIRKLIFTVVYTNKGATFIFMITFSKCGPMFIRSYCTHLAIGIIMTSVCLSVCL